MNLGVSISNLLRRYPAVGVAGIGVFRKNHHPASYDAAGSVFLPPADHVDLVDNDPANDVFQLTTYLAAQQQTDVAAAEEMLDAAVGEIMDTISRDGEAMLDGLGYLLADGASFIFKSFEMRGPEAKPIAAQAPAVHIPEKPVTRPDEGGDIPVKQESERVATGEDTVAPRRKTVWIVIGAVAAVMIAAVAVWKYQPEADLPESSAASEPLVAVGQDATVADTSAVIATEVPTPVDSVPAASVPPVKPSVTYEIIVGSFATMRQASKFVAEMKAKGYDLQAIDSRMPGNRKKISWGSYATEEEAYKELARVQKTFEPGAWIAKITHN